MASALITGIGGSGGSYLAEYIASEHPSVAIHGIARWHSATTHSNLEGVRSRVTLHECDLCDLGSVIRVLETARPDLVFHLASHANVRASFDTPLAVLENNIRGTANLLEALRLAESTARIQICSTSEVYGQVAPDEVPIKETQPFRPASPYAVSKVTQDLLGYTYHTAWKLHVIRTRMFAYLNPRRHDLFATAFAMQVARIEAGLQNELRHGNLESIRTIIDVRDAMESYWVAAEKGRPGEAYNIGGKTTISVGDFLEILRRKARVPIPARPDPLLFRPADVTRQLPDTSKFERETGWRPKFSFEESVDFLLAECRERVAREAGAC